MNHQSSSHGTRPATIRLQPNRIACILAVAAAGLVLVSLSVQFVRHGLGHDYVFGLLPIVEQVVHVDREQNVPALFSVIILLCSAALLGVIGGLKRQRRDPDVAKWMILSGGFIYLAADEGWSLHEQLIMPVRGLLGEGDLGIFYFAWVIPALATVTVLTLLFLGFLSRLPPSTRWSFIRAGSLSLGGAIGVEMLGGRQAEIHGYDDPVYQCFAHLEEGLEMAGVILFIHALLRYLIAEFPEIHVLGHLGTPLPVPTSRADRARMEPHTAGLHAREELNRTGR